MLRIIPACDGQAVTGRLLNFPVTAKLQRNALRGLRRVVDSLLDTFFRLVTCLD